MSAPTVLQLKQYSTAAASTSHAITFTSPIAKAAGAVGPSTLLAHVGYGGATGNKVSGVTDTDGNTWQRGTSTSDGVSVNGEVWYAFNAKGGLAPTVTINLSASLAITAVIEERDQIIPIHPVDGVSSPLDRSAASIVRR